MKSIVLVHGAWHGARCWSPLKSILEARGLKVVALDLPGAGEDTTPLNSIRLEDYASRVVEAIDAAGGQVLLVGHSFGGVAITAAAERTPEKIARLVYLSAHLPLDGESTLALMSMLEDDGQPSHPVHPVDEGAGLMIDGATLAAFYDDCDEASLADARAYVRPVPTAVAASPISVSALGAGSLPRSYIICESDRSMYPERQRRMAARVEGVEMHRVAGGHFAFISHANEVADILVDLAER